MILHTPKPHFERLGLIARTLVSWILAGLSTNLRTRDVEQRIAARPFKEQSLLVSAVLVALVLLTLIFGQAGWGGVLAFWAALYFVVR